MNKTILIGRLTRDPELRVTNSGVSVGNFSLAVDRKFAKEGEQQADFIQIVVWNKVAENVAKYLAKGSRVAIDGRIQTSNYDDKDGKKVYKTEVIAESVVFLDNKKKSEDKDFKEAEKVFKGEFTDMEDEIPF